MKKAIYVLLLFFALQLAGGVLAQVGVNVQNLLQHKDFDFNSLATNPTAMGLTLLLTCTLTLAVLYLCRLLFPSVRLVRHNRAWLWAVGLFVPTLFVVNLLTEYLELRDILGMAFDSMKSNPVCILAIAFVGPVEEEFVFRRAIMGSLLSEGRGVAFSLLASAAVFAIVHMNPAQMPGAFLLGLLLGWVYVRTGSVWTSCLLHVLNNSLSLLLLNVCPEFGFRHSLNVVSQVSLVVVALVVLLFLLKRFNRATPQPFMSVLPSLKTSDHAAH